MDNSKLLYIDMETTGVEENDKICSIATLDEETLKLNFDLVNEGKKIPPKASSINNITNEMIKNKPSLKQSYTFKNLQTISNDKILTAHNINFDLNMLFKAGFRYENDFIDTLRVSKHLMPDLESYGLNFLRYELKLYKKEKELLLKIASDEPIIPHNSKSDVIITKLLCDYLLELSNIQEKIRLSLKPVLLQKFEFGKYAGRYIEEISLSDKNYLNWMLNNLNLDEDLRYTLEYYL